MDSKSALFTTEELSDKTLKKVNKSSHVKDKEFVNIFDLLDNDVDFKTETKSYHVPLKAEYLKKDDDIDRSTLYSFGGLFELLHADVGNLELLGKSAADPKCLSNVYPMKNRKLIALKLEKFYKNVSEKRKNKKMRLQTDLQFKQNKVFDLNKKYNVEMFSAAVRSGKAFAAKQKIRELKKRISKLLALSKNMKIRKSPNETTSKAVDDMNSLPTIKYGIAPDTVEEKSLSSEAYKEWFDIRRLQKVSKAANRQERYETKKYLRKRRS